MDQTSVNMLVEASTVCVGVGLYNRLLIAKICSVRIFIVFTISKRQQKKKKT